MSLYGAGAMWILSLCIVQPALALTGGTFRSGPDTSAVKLQLNTVVWNARAGQYWVYDSTCSGVVVGTEPFTVLTASHCLNNLEAGADGLPIVKLGNVPSNPTSPLVLKKVVRSSPGEIRINYGADVAFLIFDGAPETKWRPVPLASSKNKNKTLICGFGSSAAETESEDPRCGTKALIADAMDFEAFLPKPYEAINEDSYARMRGTFEMKQNRGNVADLLAVNRLNAQNEYDIRLPIPKLGDSGGPWFSRDEAGTRVIALTSFTNEFTEQSLRETLAKDSKNEHDAPYAAYGIRLDNPSSLKVIRRALHAGADVRFADNFPLMGPQAQAGNP